MRFSFRKKPRWVDSEALRWTPPQPLTGEPRASKAEPAASNDQAESPQPVILLPAPATQQPQTEPHTDSPPQLAQAAAPPLPANANRAPAWTEARLLIGAGQGLCLYLLLQTRALHLWPGSDPLLFAGLSLPLLLAPLLFLEGLGTMPRTWLSAWCGGAALMLASLGLYHHWRIQGIGQPHAGLALALLCALWLTTAHVWMRAIARTGTLIPAYVTLFDTGWTVAARLCVWAAVTATAWAMLGAGNSAINALRAQFPLLSGTTPSLVILPLVGMASAGAFALTAGGRARAVRAALLTVLTLALPVLIGAALLLPAMMTTMSAWAALGLALALLLALNASYGGGLPRNRWRHGWEGIAPFAMLALLAIAALDLHARVAAFGWTAPRIQAAAIAFALALYALGSAASVLIALGGGRWMQRLEIINPILSLAVVAGCLALASPLADPLKLAVDAQAARLRAGADPDMFDFAWLKNRGGRFGAEALMRLAIGPSPDIARAASAALTAPPDADAPPPSQIGANITVRTPGARLPDALLAQDWVHAPGPVPPCLTKPALACDAWFLDLDGDGAREILLVHGTDARWWASVLKQVGGQWHAAASFASPRCHGLLTALRQGRFQQVAPLPGWRDLLVAGLRITAKQGPAPEPPCPKLN